VISTAYLDEAERCNRLTLMHSGRALYCDTPAALKKHMPGTLIAISSTDGRAVRSAITGQPGVSQVLLVGDGVHAVVDDADLRIPQLRDAIRLADVPISGVAVASPSIEDVFVALLETGEAP
jgi:ABC-2 type transport system ATP-binding protein